MGKDEAGNPVFVNKIGEFLPCNVTACLFHLFFLEAAPSLSNFRTPIFQLFTHSTMQNSGRKRRVSTCISCYNRKQKVWGPIPISMSKAKRFYKISATDAILAIIVCDDEDQRNVCTTLHQWLSFQMLCHW